MERNASRVGLLNFLLLLVTAAAGLLLARHTQTLAGQAAMALVACGVLAALLAWFQTRLEDREAQEKLEFEELQRAAQGSSLFETGDAEIFPAQRAREQFGRFIVPGATLLLFLLQAGGAAALWLWLDRRLPAALNQPLLTMALYGMLALILFLVGRYGTRRAHLGGLRLLRPSAAYVLAAAYVTFAAAAALGAVQAGFPAADALAARLFVLLLGLAAVETLATLVLEVYRPRVRGRGPERVIYESRLVALIGQPESLFTTAAQALDYQFGFKVSETGFYQFLRQNLGWLVLAQLTVLLLSTTVVFVDAGEQALLERNGAPVRGREVLGPGLHFKLPWPVDRTHRFRTLEVQEFVLGVVPDPDKEHETTLVWTVAHYQEEFNLLVASRAAPGAAADQAPPVNLLTASIPVQFQIRDLRAWALNHRDAGALLEKLALREVVRHLVGADFFEVMSTGRDRVAAELRERIQAEADRQQLGVGILFVGLQDIHPPVKVAKDFNAVVAALQEKEAAILRARAYAVTNAALTRAEATNRVRQAEAHRTRVVAATRAQAAQFTNQVAAWRQAPEVFAQRAYLQRLAAGAAGARKVVLTTTNAPQVLQLNLEDKLGASLAEDVVVAPSRR
jgi:regulator of protease activity HflC (stomatin/prohibitin superfamily)/divalent metal cation (Fe/Co/Zn/Cd) transporter